MSHHVHVQLLDGRTLMADYRQPVVHVMRRHLQRVQHDYESSGPRQVGCQADLDDMALLAEFLDVTPELACQWPPGSGCAPHGPAERDSPRPPRYVRPGTQLW